MKSVIRIFIIGALLSGVAASALSAQSFSMSGPQALQGSSAEAFSSLPISMSSGQSQTLTRVHKLSGYGALILGGLAAVSSSSRSLHYAAAYSATGLGVLACATGFKIYGPHIRLSAGVFNPANRHWILGTLGTVLGAAAVISADNGNRSGHSGLGIGGGVLMTISVLSLKISF